MAATLKRKDKPIYKKTVYHIIANTKTEITFIYGCLSFLDLFWKVEQTTCKDFAIYVVLFVMWYWLLSINYSYFRRSDFAFLPTYQLTGSTHQRFIILILAGIDINQCLIDTCLYVLLTFGGCCASIFKRTPKNIRTPSLLLTEKITLYRDGVYQ